MFGGTVKVTPLGGFVIMATGLALIVLYMRSGTRPGDAGVATTSAERLNLRQLLAVGLWLAEQAGDSIRLVHESKKLNTLSKGKTKEGAAELLTDADKHAHAIIVNGMKSVFPDVQIISEEHDEELQISDEGSVDGTKFLPELMHLPETKEPLDDVVVWVDPLDATQEFTEDLVKYVTVMICITVKGLPIVGIIHRPFVKKTVWGWTNHGTSKNLERPRNGSSNVRRIIVSRSHPGEVKRLLVGALGNETEIVPAGGSGYKTLQVVEGEADAYVHTTAIKKWDVCAPNALLEAAGGRMTSLDGTRIDYSAASPEKTGLGILATSKGHEVYLKLLKDLVPGKSTPGN